jgi:hypothetical protein
MQISEAHPLGCASVATVSKYMSSRYGTGFKQLRCDDIYSATIEVWKVNYSYDIDVSSFLPHSIGYAGEEELHHLSVR